MSRRRPERPLSHEPWPTDLDRADPFAEPDHFDPGKVAADYETAGGSAPVEEVLSDTRAARVALGQAWRTGDTTALGPLAARLRLDAPRDAFLRHYPPFQEAASDETLARIATDMLPAIGNDAPDRLLGPWASLARPGADARLLQIATAAGAFMPPDETPFDARHQWSRRKPEPTDAERSAVRAVAHAPYTAWPILALGDPCWRLGPAVGVEAAGEVWVDRPARLPGLGPPRAGDTLLARVVSLPGGAVARLPIVCPGPIPEAAEGWLDLLLLERRLTDRRAGPRDVLRSRGHVLVRRVLEAAWIR